MFSNSLFIHYLESLALPESIENIIGIEIETSIDIDVSNIKSIMKLDYRHYFIILFNQSYDELIQTLLDYPYIRNIGIGIAYNKVDLLLLKECTYNMFICSIERNNLISIGYC